MFIRLMADYSSDGVWAASGAMADRESLPVSRELKEAIERWCLDYEGSQFYLDREDRTIDFDTDGLNARGEALAERLRAELPGWQVVHQPQS